MYMYVQLHGKKYQLFLEDTHTVKTGRGKSQIWALISSLGPNFSQWVLVHVQLFFLIANPAETQALCRLLLIPVVINILFWITLSDFAPLIKPQKDAKVYQLACISSLILSHLPFHALCCNHPLYIPMTQTLYMLFFLTGLPPHLSLAFAQLELTFLDITLTALGNFLAQHLPK